MNTVKKRCFPLLYGIPLLCAVSLLALPLSARAVTREGKTASNQLLALDVLSVETAGILDQNLIGENLDKPVNQLTGAALLARLSGADTSSAPPAPGASGNAAKDAGFAISKGWVDGGKFNANGSLDADDWFAMLLRFLGYKDFNEKEAALSARRIGLVSREFKGNLTGGDLAETAKAVLRFPYKDGTGTVAAKLILQGKCNPGAFTELGITGRDWSVREAADWCMAAVFGLELEPADPKEKDTMKASGFFVTPDGVAVTCFHSIQGASKGTATLVTGEKFEVQSVLWYDVKSDLALLRISKSSTEGKTASEFAYLEIAGTKEVHVGDMSYALGCPLGVGLAAGQGLVISTGVEVERYGLPCLVSAATITFGSGGGALLNTAGKVIGVTAGAFQYGNEMYLSIPADTLADAIKKAGGGQPLSAVSSANPKPEPEKEELEGEGECVIKSSSDGKTVTGKFTVKDAEENLEIAYEVEGEMKGSGEGTRKATGKLGVTKKKEKKDWGAVVDY